MLREIEAWLEYLLHVIQQLPPDQVEAKQKEKENTRRTNMRVAKKEEQKQQYAERLAKSAARATAEVVKSVRQSHLCTFIAFCC